MQIMETLDDPELSHDDILHILSALNPGDGIEMLRRNDPAPLLQLLLEVAPLRYDFAPLQRGPGQWRYVVRVRDNRSLRSVMRYLTWDHDRLDSLLNAAVNLARTDQWREAHVPIVDFAHGLLRHIDIEENDLFPVFDRVAEDGPTEVMRHDHEAIKECVEGMLKATASRHIDDFERSHADLLGVLIEHNMKEENIVYPLTDRALADAERNALVETMMLH